MRFLGVTAAALIFSKATLAQISDWCGSAPRLDNRCWRRTR